MDPHEMERTKPRAAMVFARVMLLMDRARVLKMIDGVPILSDEGVAEFTAMIRRLEERGICPLLKFTEMMTCLAGMRCHPFDSAGRLEIAALLHKLDFYDRGGDANLYELPTAIEDFLDHRRQARMIAEGFVVPFVEENALEGDPAHGDDRPTTG